MNSFREQILNAGDATLTIGLLGVAAFLVFVALTEKRPLVKAAVLAWVILP